MKINGPLSPDTSATNPKPVREVGVAEPIGSTKTAPSDVSTKSAKPRDSVEISDAGRVMAGMEPLSADRVADVRQRILSGAYNATQVIDTVARRILQRGDI